jgi:hypothetical protein
MQPVTFVVAVVANQKFSTVKATHKRKEIVCLPSRVIDFFGALRM